MFPFNSIYEMYCKFILTISSHYLPLLMVVKHMALKYVSSGLQCKMTKITKIKYILSYLWLSWFWLIENFDPCQWSWQTAVRLEMCNFNGSKRDNRFLEVSLLISGTLLKSLHLISSKPPLKIIILLLVCVCLNSGTCIFLTGRYFVALF